MGVKTEAKERAQGSTGAIEKGRKRTYRLAEGPIDGWIFFLFIGPLVFFFWPDVDQLWRNVKKCLQDDARRETGATYKGRNGILGKHF